MAVIYLAAGLAHWFFPKVYLGILPPWMPWKRAVVWASGLAEVLLGAALFMPGLAPWALYGIMLMLVAFLPVHAYMLRAYQKFRKIPLWALWLRIPLQGALIYWAYAYL